MHTIAGKVRQNLQHGEVLEWVRRSWLILRSISWGILGLIRIGGGFMIDFIFGCVIGFIFSLLIFSIITPNDDAIKNCEKDLPRTQHCKIIAVPEEIKTEAK